MPEPHERRSDYLTLAEAAQLTPRRPTAGTLWRWARRGVRARDGRSIRLRHVRVGGRVYTTEQWLHEFFEELAAADLANTRWQHPNRTPLPSTLAAHDAADAELREAGL